MTANRWSASPLLYGARDSVIGVLAKSPMKRRWQRGLHLLTGIGRTMKNHLLPLLGKLLPRKRSSIATLFAKLKSGMGLEHNRHRSPRHTLVHRPLLPGGLLPGLTSLYPQLGFKMDEVAIRICSGSSSGSALNQAFNRSRFLIGHATRERSNTAIDVLITQECPQLTLQVALGVDGVG